VAALQIPEIYKSGLAKLLALSQGSSEALLAALKDAPPVMSTFDLSSLLASKVKSVSREELEDIADTLVSLYLTQQHHPDSGDELVEDICRAMDKSDAQELKLSEENRDHFKNLLTALLKTEALVYASKAVSVLRDNERMFCNARILTDIRPIFGSRVEVPPKAAVIVQMLNITYHQGEDLKEFYVGLDTDDVETLRAVLERADLKAKSLRSVFEAARLKDLTSD
jgi:hypothetical protein